MKKLIIPFFVMGAIFTYSYTSFASYEPRNLSQLSEVKGTKTKDELYDIPFPDNSLKVSTYKNALAEGYVFESNKTPEEIITFYKNIYIEEKWKIKMEGLQDNFYVSMFKKDKNYFTVKAIEENEKTAVTIQVSQEQ